MCRHGSAFVRPGASGHFRELPLMRDGATNRLVARFRRSIASSREGFTYYAEIETAPEGASVVTLPAGGASAPHRSLPPGRRFRSISEHTASKSLLERTRRGSRLGRRAERGRARARTQRPSDRSVRVRRRCERHGRAPRPGTQALLRWRQGAFTDAGTPRGRRDARRHDARPGRNRLRPRVGRPSRSDASCAAIRLQWALARLDRDGRKPLVADPAWAGWSRRPSAAFPTVDAGRGRRIARRARRSTPGRSRGPIARRRNRSHRARPQQRDSCRSRRFGRCASLVANHE